MTVLERASDWRDEFVLVREARARGQEAELTRLARSGVLHPVARGVYRRSEFVEIDPTQRRADAFLARVRATHLLWDGELVFAGFAAAAVWRIPTIGPPPKRIDVASAPAQGGRSNAALRRSYVPDVTEYEVIDGLRVTPLARTVIDVARWGSFSQGVIACDAALHGSQKEAEQIPRTPLALSDLTSAGRMLGPIPGKRKCSAVVAFSDERAESAGESLSRVAIYHLGMPAPVLQQAFFDRSGLAGIVDFWWPEFNLIGEFDGYGKYIREEFTRGKDTASIVIEEKRRENRLRETATRPNVTRWDWSIATSLPRLRAQLRSAGLPETTRPR